MSMQPIWTSIVDAAWSSHAHGIKVSDNTPTTTDVKHASGVNQAYRYQLSEFTSLMPVKSANILIINVFISVDLITYQYSYQ